MRIFPIIVCLNLVFLMPPAVSATSEASKPQIPQDRPLMIVPQFIDRKPDGNQMKQILAYLDRTFFADRNLKRLKDLSKSFLFYKLGNCKASLELIKNIGETNTDDLKHYITAECGLSLANESPHANDPVEQEKLIRNSVANYKRILDDYRTGPFFKPAKESILRAKVKIADLLHDAKDFSDAAKQYTSLLENHSKELSRAQKGKIYSNLGEALFRTKNYETSRKAFIKAKLYGVEDKKIENRLKRFNALEPIQSRDKQDDEEIPRKTGLTSPLESPDKKSTDKERPLYEKSLTSFENEDYFQALEAISNFINNYPGSKYIPDSRNLALKSVNLLIRHGKSRIPWGSHYRHSLLNSKAIKHINMMDLKTRIAISSALYRSEFLEDVAKILESLVKNYPHSDFAPRACLLLARIYRVYGKLSKAIHVLKTLNEKYSSSSLSNYALFKIGLLYFQQEKWKKAIRHFKAYIDNNREKFPPSEGLWWLAKAYEKTNNIPYTRRTLEILRDTSPLSFYSVIEGSYSHLLRLNADKKPAFESEPTSKLLTLLEENHLRRALDFAAMGLVGYAEHELGLIKPDERAEVNAYLSWLLSGFGSHRKAIYRTTKALTSKPQILDKNILSIAFPKEHMKRLIEQNNLYGIDHLLLLSLIKQESAFANDAVSRSGARGLMQLMPFTADYIASRLLLSGNVPKDNLFDPSVSISLATFYFYYILKSLDGNVIYALASYNAGPGRFKEWYRQNRHLTDMEFIEQIPVGETNQYVKNIIRNYIFYAYIADKKLVSLDNLKNTKPNDFVFVRP